MKLSASFRASERRSLARGPRETGQLPTEVTIEHISEGGQRGRLIRLSAFFRRHKIEGDLIFVVVFLLLLGTFLSFASPYFFTKLNLTNVLLQASVLAIIGCGVTIVIVSGNFDLSVGSGLALSMVVAALAMRHFDSIPIGLGAGIGVGIAIGLINGLAITLLRVPSFIQTLAMLVIARGLAEAISGGRTVYPIPGAFFDFMNRDFLGVGMIFWIAVAVFAVFHLILRYT